MRILVLTVAGCAAALTSAPLCAAAPAYRPIAATMENRTVVLTGQVLTVEQVVEVARYPRLGLKGATLTKRGE